MNNNGQQKKRKDRRGIKRTFAYILLAFQAIGIWGNIESGEFGEVLTQDAAYLIGYFLFAIIAVILLVSAHNEGKKIEDEEILGSISEGNPYDEPIGSTNDGCFCRRCGQKIEQNAKFCTNCGEKVEKDANSLI